MFFLGISYLISSLFDNFFSDLPVEDKAPTEGNETEPITEAGEAEDQGEQPTEEDAEEEPLQIGGGEEEAQLEEPVPMDTPPGQ